MLKLQARLLDIVPLGLKDLAFHSLASLLLVFVQQPVIRYRGQRIYLLTKDLSSAQIVAKYMFYRSWKHETGEQAIVEQIITRRARPTVFIDGGASFGMFSFLAASLPEVRQVIAVEASPRTFEQLSRSVSESAFAALIECHCGGLTDRCDRILGLADSNKPSEWFTIVEATDHTAEKVSALTLDNLAANIGADDSLFIKLDIEGSEETALRGMHETFARHEDIILMIEFHAGILQRNANGARDFARFLMALGCDGTYVMHSTQARLHRLATPDAFYSLADRFSEQKFPRNLCNLLLTRQPLPDDIIAID